MAGRFIYSLLIVFVSISCKTSAPEAGLSNEQVEAGIFVGCVPFMGECTVSCPQRNGMGRRPDHLCKDETSPVACYCPAGTMAPPPVDGSKWEFQTCVPSANECQYSANAPEQIYVVADPTVCDTNLGPALACYHLRKSQ